MRNCYMHPYYLGDMPMTGWRLGRHRLAGYMRGTALWQVQ